MNDMNKAKIQWDAEDGNDSDDEQYGILQQAITLALIVKTKEFFIKF